jgi:hypothetical protein
MATFSSHRQLSFTIMSKNITGPPVLLYKYKGKTTNKKTRTLFFKSPGFNDLVNFSNYT